MSPRLAALSGPPPRAPRLTRGCACVSSMRAGPDPLQYLPVWRPARVAACIPRPAHAPQVRPAASDAPGSAPLALGRPRRAGAAHACWACACMMLGMHAKLKGFPLCFLPAMLTWRGQAPPARPCPPSCLAPRCARSRSTPPRCAACTQHARHARHACNMKYSAQKLSNTVHTTSCCPLRCSAASGLPPPPFTCASPPRLLCPLRLQLRIQGGYNDALLLRANLLVCHTSARGCRSEEHAFLFLSFPAWGSVGRLAPDPTCKATPNLLPNNQAHPCFPPCLAPCTPCSRARD